MIINKIISFSFIVSIFISSIFAGALTGTVKYDGKAMPKQASTQLKMDADPVCGSKHQTPVYRQSLIVNDNKTLKNTLVYLNNIMRKVAVLTGTRADYGLLYPILKKMEEVDGLQLQLIVLMVIQRVQVF